MSILCWFNQCRWLHIFNVPTARTPDGQWRLFGVYQCPRCKTVSVGTAQVPENSAEGLAAALAHGSKQDREA